MRARAEKLKTLDLIFICVSVLCVCDGVHKSLGF